MKRAPLFLFVISLAIQLSGCSSIFDDYKSKGDREKEQISKEVIENLEGAIIYRDDNYGLYKKIPGSSNVKLSSQCYSSPKFSNDGSLIAYIGIEPALVSEFNLKICDTNGNEKYSWLLGRSDEMHGSFRGITWSPDANYIAVLKDYNEVIYVDVSSGEMLIVKLVNTEGYFFSAIAWNPINNKIALAETYSDFFYRKDEINSNIWMIEAFSKDPHEGQNKPIYSTKGSPIITISHLDWSPDGSMLVYSEDDFGSIFTINSDGSNNQEIILKGVYEGESIYGYAPCWMSNNEQIIFYGSKAVKLWTMYNGLFVTDINGSYKVDLDIAGWFPDCF